VEQSLREAVLKPWVMRNIVDPDQDLLDELDRQEGPGWFLVITGAAGLAALAGLIAYFTMVLELRTSGEIAADVAILTFAGSAAVLSIGFYKFR